MKLHYILPALALAAAATAWADPYKVIAPFGDDYDGAMAVLMDFDSGNQIDSTLIADGAAVFEGQLDEPTLARIVVDGGRMPVFILESGTISFGKDNQPFGSMLNDRLRALGTTLNETQQRYYKADTDSARNAIYNEYLAALDSTMKDNADNLLGYYVFLNSDASQMDAPELRAELKKYPAFAGRPRVQKMLAAATRREATQPGNKFTDFEITNDGVTQRLSDFAGKGKYTLVDFWASWCGPCRRQIPVIKSLKEKYGDRLDVVGIAVWDEADDTRRAIEEESITWPTVLNAGTVPTDLYGITGIPCIMLIAPDGTIVSRDKQGDELVSDVDSYLSKE